MRHRTFIKGVLASSAISLPVILDNISEHVVLSFLHTFSVNCPDSQLKKSDKTTEEPKGRRRRLVSRVMLTNH